MFELPKYNMPDFSDKKFIDAPNANLVKVCQDKVAPDNFLATSIYPTYVKVGGQWLFVEKIRMDCVLVLKDNKLFAVEFRRLQKGDLVVCGRHEDCTQGIYVNYDPFPVKESNGGTFSFRQNQTRESSYSRMYDELYEILRHDHDHGNILWVSGPATVFDRDSREAFSNLVKNGYVSGVLAGNAFGTHDLEASLFHTALGQDIYTKENVFNGHYHHIEVLNRVKSAGSIKNFIEKNNIQDGVIYNLEKYNIPYVLCGSIRDDGPLPPVIADVYEGQNQMRNLIENATTIIALCTQLHTIATGNMTPCYFTNPDGTVRPVYFYMVDISEFVLNKLTDRGSLSSRGIVTNVQDFLVNIERNLRK